MGGGKISWRKGSSGYGITGGIGGVQMKPSERRAVERVFFKLDEGRGFASESERRLNLLSRIFQGLAERGETFTIAEIKRDTGLSEESIKFWGESFRRKTESQENPSGILVLKGQKIGYVPPKRKPKAPRKKSWR